ncbi:arsenate reductase (glutaredoxin) [Alcaligenes ammonioxydans]|jgi:arsenate reductase|uniref:Arsenate reductase n=1 Tax=Alcaligenes ammonioxydans TaxID=2582914 RepID=A0ABX8ST50_9BURK|nr:arsenate reductase (glutaredoxin) [Alcaligenes ammonioxydans]EJC65569.1 arsenate reductase [Alcaligenes faecalis subsp. faecalis NCIB 8687]QBH18066.1 arsenate reductase (glutaredoxin) [Alcaligenes faecalis]MCH1878417.1 arsenate reductase (glutaredoxin) [Alcaligenes ammonioxydans]QXX79217.1 arsenate reductase (glutaredoxin) [Alcaligenes ammonioxydans]WGQ34129.1 arsenate reductase (glutaredoxin) [Alcaligenes faecalis]
MSKIYHNPRCSTSRNALVLMREKGREPEIIEYLKTPLSRSELKALIAATGLTVREAMRSKEAIYSELNLDNPDLSDEELLAALEANPILLNRPIVVTEKGTRLARPLEVVQEIL